MKSFVTIIALGILPRVWATQSDLIEWVRSKGGSFSKKLEIRKHPLGYMGVFATEDIGAKETLFQIPQECYIHIFDDIDDTYNLGETTEAKFYENYCMLAHKLMKEMELSETSDFAPYIAYLKTQEPGQLPANWPNEGKDLLRQVATPGSTLVDWLDANFKHGKCINDDPFEEHMVEMVVQRGFDVALIPIFDMVNHDNGGKINVETNSMHEKDGIKARASREINAGEELFFSYDSCVDCGSTASYWGTPEILRDFGFLEEYPHRWVFLNEGIWFHIEEEDDVVAYFDDEYEDSYGIPDERQIEFLEAEINRLQIVGKTVLADQGNVPDREWQIIKDFHAAALRDISCAIKDASLRNSLSEDEL